MTTRLSLLATALAATTVLGLTLPALADPPSCIKANSEYETLRLTDLAAPPIGEPLFLFALLSDVHIYDDDGSPVFNGSELEPALEPTIANGSAQRFQDEYTDEVLNAMVKTINSCNAGPREISLMIATGDNTDTYTLNEVRRFIDNLDGVSGAQTIPDVVANLTSGASSVTTAFEKNCGYLTHDSNGNPKVGGAVPCTAELQQIATIATGKLVADSHATDPDPENPVDQFMPTRSPRQNASAITSSAIGLSYSIAPGLPLKLRCDDGEPNCPNRALDVPYFAVFGNHDGAVRGTVTMERPFQAGTLAHGRYFFQSQREWLNEFFFTTEAPGPVGHGFQFSDNLADADDRNDGYYVFGVVQKPNGNGNGNANGHKVEAVGPTDAKFGDSFVRMIVLNTLYDGVRNELHRNGQTNTDTQGLVAGNEVTNPIGLETGVIDAVQFDWLRDQLAAAAAEGVPALVFSHHPDRSFSDQRLGFAADGGKTSVELDQLLGTAEFDENPSTLVAHIAGHTHENIIRACKVDDCPLGAENVAVERAFWRVETASLIDYPQEGRIVELFDLCAGATTCALPPGRRFALRMTMISPDQNDSDAKLSHDLSIAEATCNLSQMIGGPLSSAPSDAESLQQRIDTIVTNGSEAAVQQKFCFGEASLALAEGDEADRDVILMP